jgi:hypothetical protein
MKYRGIIAGLVVFGVAAAASAQTLGDVAKKEAERRKTVKATGKVYTNDSLRTEPPAPPPAQPATQPATQPGTAQVAPSPSGAQAGTAQPGQQPAQPDPTKTEAYWKQRITAERDALSRAQTFAEALQSRINVLSQDFVNRDDPAQRNVVAADRQKALAELDRVKNEIAQHTKAIADIQEEARKAGVPAGWVR